MVRITDNALIIEIPVKTKSALETLSELQSGIHDVISSIDFTNASPEKITWGMTQLMQLLNEMNITSDQSAIIVEALTNKKDQLSKFNRA